MVKAVSEEMVKKEKEEEMGREKRICETNRRGRATEPDLEDPEIGISSNRN